MVGPETAAKLREFIDHPEPPLAEEEWIEAQIGALSIKPKRKSSVAEEALLVEVYVRQLSAHSRVDLGYAFGRLMREKKWFPDVSEIIDLAGVSKSKRQGPRNKAKSLVMKHEREWIADVEQVTPEEARQIMEEEGVGKDPRADLEFEDKADG